MAGEYSIGPAREGELWKGKPGVLRTIDIIATETGFLARSPEFPELIGRGSGLYGAANAVQHFAVLLDYHLKGIEGGRPGAL